jgi:pSer/pThr/pTyr-binding forkhead associated (FHA) protein
MDVRLVVMSASQQQGRSIRIPRFPFVIGRDPQCQLRPRSVLVSRRHCVLVERGDNLFAEDLESSNGTFVNDHRILGSIQLLHGDRLKVGPLILEVRLHAGLPHGEGPLRPQQAAADFEDEPTTALGQSAAAEAAGSDTPPNAPAPTIPTGPTQVDLNALPRLNSATAPPSAGNPSTKDSASKPRPSDSADEKLPPR